MCIHLNLYTHSHVHRHLASKTLASLTGHKVIDNIYNFFNSITHSEFPLTSASTLAGQHFLPCRVIQTFITEVHESSVLLTFFFFFRLL